MEHPLAWTSPQPFWTPGAATELSRAAIAQPQILRFANDEFIEELLATLEQNPAALASYAATAETWRGPGRAPAALASPWAERLPTRLLGIRRKALAKTSSPAAMPAPTALKLYQPAHQRHYLVAGSLVCQAPGLPDRRVDPARQRVSFVVRRLLPKVAKPPESPLPDPGDASQWREHAWVMSGKDGEWRCAVDDDGRSDPAALVGGEERLAMFPARFTQVDGYRRRLYIGNVPVGRRETYQGAQAKTRLGETPAGGAAPMDPRLVMFHTQVLGPWKAMVAQAMRNGEAGKEPGDLVALRAARPERIFKPNIHFDPADPNNPGQPGYDAGQPDKEALRSERARLQTASWYLLLDLMNFLQVQLPGFWRERIQGQAASADPIDPTLPALYDDLYNALNDTTMPADLGGAGLTLASTNTGTSTDPVSLADLCTGYEIKIGLIDALQAAAVEQVGELSYEQALDAASTPFELPASGVDAQWPGFLFLFADPWFGVMQPPQPGVFTPVTTDYLSERIVAVIDTLADRVDAVLAAIPATGNALPEPTLASMQPADMREAWYVMRLVYERPDCAPFEAAVISRPTQPFQMAGFFDPDAPARPIRIGLPLDLSPAGLRKFDKNTVFMMSDMLCGHIDRFKGMTLGDLVLSVLPWPFHKDLSVPDKGPCKTGSPALSLGVMCSLSIPIITICALILLMIIVSLLDVIFRWLPLFIVCFPLPGFKGKKDS